MLSCPAARRLENQILSQMITRIATMMLSSLISMNTQLSVSDEQIDDVTVQAVTV